MITRREFGAGVILNALGTRMEGGDASDQRPRRRNTLMHVGGDYHSVLGGEISSSSNLAYNLRHGVKHLTAQFNNQPGKAWDTEELKRIRDNCARYGVVLEAIRMESDYIRLPKGPERDRELDVIAANIRKSAQVGVKIVTYHWELIPYRRNAERKGRGDVTYKCFRLEEDWKNLPSGDVGRVTREEYWERLRYFLEKIIPVARDNGVFMACHPSDPPVLPAGYQGIDQWASPDIFEALRRYEAVVDSPYNGFQLDLGTTAAGLKNASAEIFPIVEYLARRGKIHQIHMRGIQGAVSNYCEVFPDEGDVDFVRVMRILRDAQFSGSICPDHMPSHADDPGAFQAYAFGYGYIKGLIQAVNTEV